MQSDSFTPGKSLSLIGKPRQWVANGMFALCVLVGTTITLGVVGCGKLDSGVRVPPPESNSTKVQPREDAPADVPVPPGEMELPDNLSTDDPSHGENTGGDPAASKGMEMPEELNLPPAIRPWIRFADWESIEKEIQDTKQITVVDFWSLSCQPCMKEFPGLVALANEFGDQIRCLSVNLDYVGRKRRPPQYFEQRAEAFLKSVHADRLTNILCETPANEVYQSTQIISLPSVLVYDQNGKRIKKFVDGGETAGFGYQQDVQPYIELLLQSASQQ